MFYSNIPQLSSAQCREQFSKLCMVLHTLHLIPLFKTRLLLHVFIYPMKSSSVIHNHSRFIRVIGSSNKSLNKTNHRSSITSMQQNLHTILDGPVSCLTSPLNNIGTACIHYREIDPCFSLVFLHRLYSGHILVVLLPPLHLSLRQEQVTFLEKKK